MSRDDDAFFEALITGAHGGGLPAYRMKIFCLEIMCFHDKTSDGGSQIRLSKAFRRLHAPE